jgi:Cu/Ag efflux protein CusF
MKFASLAAATLLAAPLATGALAHDLKGAMGEHVMTGTITKIDHEKGTITLDTQAAPLALHFPPSALKDMKEGDRVAVEMSISRTLPGAAGKHEHR